MTQERKRMIEILKGCLTEKLLTQKDKLQELEEQRKRIQPLEEDVRAAAADIELLKKSIRDLKALEGKHTREITITPKEEPHYTNFKYNNVRLIRECATQIYNDKKGKTFTRKEAIKIVKKYHKGATETSLQTLITKYLQYMLSKGRIERISRGKYKAVVVETHRPEYATPFDIPKED